MTDTGAIDFGRSGATGLAKQVVLYSATTAVVVMLHDRCVAPNEVKRHPRVQAGVKREQPE